MTYAAPGGVYFSTLPAGTSCTVNVTTYGAVGDLIEGNFSALVSDGQAVPTTHTIANGSFSVNRLSDL